MTPLTPDQARDQLDVVDTFASTTRDAARRSAKVGAAFTAAIGLLVGAVLASTYAFAPHNKLAFTLTFGVYGVALALLIAYQRRNQTVSERGWGRAYLFSLLSTMTLYVAGIYWVTSVRPSWALVAPYCVLVALPMLVGARLMLRGIRR